MKEIRLEDFEKQIIVRAMRLSDYDALVEIQRQCFPNMRPWKKEEIKSHIEIFPEGQIVIEYEGKIVASSSSLIVNFEQYTRHHDWITLTNHGRILNHDPLGDTLYGMEIMVDAKYRGMKLARRLYDARKKLAVERNLQRIILGGRIPGYAAHVSEMTAREYVDKVMQKVLFDPVLTVQIANGFVLKRLIPNYFKSDQESKGFATFLEWTNLDYVPDEEKALVFKPSVRICIVQMEMREARSFAEFAKACEFFVDAASEYKSDFAVFPEGITFQLLNVIHREKSDLGVRHLSDFTAQYLELFTDLAVKYNVNIIGGSHLSLENEKLYNIAYLFKRDGTLGKQPKLQVAPDESRWWGVNAGNRVEVFETDCGPIAIQVGSDIEFPEAARIALERGAQVIFVPFASEERYAHLRIRNCAQARAIENQIYVVTAGMVGIKPNARHFDIRYAQSGVYTPAEISQMRGGIPTECPPNVETVMFEELDLALLRKMRMSEAASQREKRRTELFRLAQIA